VLQCWREPQVPASAGLRAGTLRLWRICMPSATASIFCASTQRSRHVLTLTAHVLLHLSECRRPRISRSYGMRKSNRARCNRGPIILQPLHSSGSFNVGCSDVDVSARASGSAELRVWSQPIASRSHCGSLSPSPPKCSKASCQCKYEARRKAAVLAPST
jgi:hypothetical protein